MERVFTVVCETCIAIMNFLQLAIFELGAETGAMLNSPLPYGMGGIKNSITSPAPHNFANAPKSLIEICCKEKYTGNLT